MLDPADDLLDSAAGVIAGVVLRVLSGVADWFEPVTVAGLSALDCDFASV